jgi:hypothetical protein
LNQKNWLRKAMTSLVDLYNRLVDQNGQVRKEVMPDIEASIKKFLQNLFSVHGCDVKLLKPDGPPSGTECRMVINYANRGSQTISFDIEEEATMLIKLFDSLKQGLRPVDINIFDLIEDELFFKLNHFKLDGIETFTTVYRKDISDENEDYYLSDHSLLIEFISEVLIDFQSKYEMENLETIKPDLKNLLNQLHDEIIYPDKFKKQLKIILKKLPPNISEEYINDKRLMTRFNKIKQIMDMTEDEKNLYNRMKMISCKLHRPSQKKTFNDPENNDMVAMTYDTYKITPVSKFAKNAIRLLTDNVEDALIVNSTSYNSWVSLKQILKSFFVEYALIFNQYENLSICENRTCDNLLVNNRNTKQFCSPKCRQAYFSKKDPRNNCRAKQNKWIIENSKYQEVNRINRDDCNNCKKKVRGGYCEHIRKKNPKLADKKPVKKNIETPFNNIPKNQGKIKKNRIEWKIKSVERHDHYQDLKNRMRKILPPFPIETDKKEPG